MQNSYTAIGTLSSDGTVKIEGPIPVPPGKVEVIIRPLSNEEKHQSIWNVIGQSSIERSKEEIDEQVRSLREEWGE